MHERKKIPVSKQANKANRRVGNIVAVHGHLDGPNTWAIWAVHIYTNK